MFANDALSNAPSYILFFFLLLYLVISVVPFSQKPQPHLFSYDRKRESVTNNNGLLRAIPFLGLHKKSTIKLENQVSSKVSIAININSYLFDTILLFFFSYSGSTSLRV